MIKSTQDVQNYTTKLKVNFYENLKITKKLRINLYTTKINLIKDYRKE